MGSECNIKNVAVLQQYTVGLLILAGMHAHHDQLYIVSCMAGVAGVSDNWACTKLKQNSWQLMMLRFLQNLMLCLISSLQTGVRSMWHFEWQGNWCAKSIYILDDKTVLNYVIIILKKKIQNNWRRPMSLHWCSGVCGDDIVPLTKQFIRWLWFGCDDLKDSVGGDDKFGHGFDDCY